jgi:SAM-dependent methyltransferase
VSEGYDVQIFNTFADLEWRSFWFRQRNQLIIDIVRREFPGAREVLEVGCGNGFALSALRTALPRTHLVGIEPFSEGIQNARSRVPDAEVIHGAVEDLDAEREFDLVCAFDVLEHVDDDALAIRKMRRALKIGGGLLIFVPQHRRLWSAADDYARHRRRYSRDALLGLVRQAGFSPVLTTSFVSILLPVLGAARWLQRTEYNPGRELVPPYGLNPLFERILQVERRLIAMGVRFPAGGTLVVAARALSVAGQREDS